MTSIGLGRDRAHGAAGGHAAYRHVTRIGTFVIREALGRWRVEHDGATLAGAYRTAEEALGDLVQGQCDWPRGVNPAELSLPDDLSRWESVPPA